VIILRRRTPTLWKGSSLVVLNGLFVLMSVVWMLTRRPAAADTGIIIFDLVLIALGLMLGRRWVLIGIDHSASLTILERCFKQTRSTAAMRGSDYVVQCGDCEMTVSIPPGRGFGSGSVWLPMHRVVFAGANSRKAVLIRSLFTKQFERSFPTPRIRA